jgi:hypothetical protein
MAYGNQKQLSFRDALQGVEYVGKPKRFEWGVVEYVTPKGDTCWRYHKTDIVVLRKNGDIILDSGGWRTYTTKEKTNSILQHIYANTNRYKWPFHVEQNKGLWTVYGGQGFEPVPYFDGVNLAKAHMVSTIAKANKAQAKQIKLRKDILNYSKLYTAESVLPDGQPTQGDCWLCSIAPNEKEHLLNHIKEGYVMTKLASNALVSNGYDKQCLLDMDSRWGIARVQNSVKKFLYKALGV